MAVDSPVSYPALYSLAATPDAFLLVLQQRRERGGTAFRYSADLMSDSAEPLVLRLWFDRGTFF